MLIGLLQTGSVQAEYQPRFKDYPDMFIDLLQRVETELKFKVYKTQAGEYPSAVHECDCYLVTGSKAAVYDREPWIEKLSDYLLELNTRAKKLAAVCFGHQLVAQTFGGITRKSEKGWGVGVHTMKVFTKEPWMQPYQDECKVVVSHQDQVMELPHGARLVAGNEFCPNSMFQLGENILTIQGHPEFSKDYSRALMEHRREQIGESTVVPALASLALPVDDLVLARWLLNFLAEK